MTAAPKNRILQSPETTLPGSALDLARQWWAAVQGDPDHYPTCDYLHREPPRDTDCDCGAINAHRSNRQDLAEDALEQFLREHGDI